MSHVTLRNSYQTLSDRLNLFPQGAPPSELLFKILEVLFTRDEAALVALLPIKPFNVAAAARIWKKPAAESRKILEGLASKGMLLDMEMRGEQIFVLPPPMAGFFEFSMMRLGNGYDQKLLAELFYQYLNVEADFVKNLFAGGETQLGRTFVNEKSLDGDNTLRVMDYERASEVIHTAAHMGVGACYCRHKMQHLGKACDAPMDICMTFSGTAQSLIKHGIARKVDVKEGMDLLDEAMVHNLVQFGENVQNNVAFICNCCGCCCEAMLAAKRFAVLNPIATTNFLPEVSAEQCSGCGKCVETCPVEAMGLVSANDPHQPKRRKARVDESLCLGCGVCVRVCAKDSIKLKAREQRVITPVTTAHRAVLMAIERGLLQNLIFDNQAQWNHRTMAAILGVILKLPPIKQVMASQQMKSRYLEHLMRPRDFVHLEH
ncbi:MAG: 4Fe-4S dicluster domain-containing protein [Terracidiphilus sp.]|nr:4Fe-4S dicluster domain-containing protein [Terracidiphilus sp.]MDR3775672.1 4Fe-4S dicluster domain-containing protein [Terracidiphilus sp.]